MLSRFFDRVLSRPTGGPRFFARWPSMFKSCYSSSSLAESDELSAPDAELVVENKDHITPASSQQFFALSYAQFPGCLKASSVSNASRLFLKGMTQVTKQSAHPFHGASILLPLQLWRNTQHSMLELETTVLQHFSMLSCNEGYTIPSLEYAYALIIDIYFHPERYLETLRTLTNFQGEEKEDDEIIKEVCQLLLPPWQYLQISGANMSLILSEAKAKNYSVNMTTFMLFLSGYELNLTQDDLFDLAQSLHQSVSDEKVTLKWDSEHGLILETETLLLQFRCRNDRSYDALAVNDDERFDLARTYDIRQDEQIFASSQKERIFSDQEGFMTALRDSLPNAPQRRLK